MAVAVMKKKTRRKLSKQLNKLIKLHGAEMALALVTGIVSALAADQKSRADSKQKQKSGRPRTATNLDRPAKAEKTAKLARPPAKAVVVRKRT